MKRCKAMGAIACVAIFLCACAPSAQEKAEQERSRLTSGLTAGFTSTMEIAYGQIRATATLDQQTPGNCKITFTQPPVMAGMSIQTEGDRIHIQYHNLSAAYTADEFFKSSVASMVVSTLNEVTSQEGLELSLQDECLSIVGSGVGNQSNGEFCVKIDRKKGNLMQLVLPEQNLSVRFRDFAFLSGENRSEYDGN